VRGFERVVQRRRDRHLQDRKPRRFEDAIDLAHGQAIVEHMLEHMIADDDIERCPPEREGRDVHRQHAGRRGQVAGHVARPARKGLRQSALGGEVQHARIAGEDVRAMNEKEIYEPLPVER